MEDATIIVIDNVLIGKDVGPQGAIVSYKDRGNADFTGRGGSFLPNNYLLYAIPLQSLKHRMVILWIH